MEILQKELPLLSKLFGDGSKGFYCDIVDTNGGQPILKKQEKKDLDEVYPQILKVKRATEISNMDSNDIEIDARKVKKSQSIVEYDLSVKDDSTPATEFGNVRDNCAAKNSNFQNIVNITKYPENLSKNVLDMSESFNISSDKTLLSGMGRVGFEPTTPAMSRRYLNQARPPALVLQLLIFFLLFIYNCSFFSFWVE